METIKALWDLLFAGDSKLLKQAEVKYVKEVSRIWMFFFAVVLGGPLFAYLEVNTGYHVFRTGIWILMLTFLVIFLTSAWRPTLSGTVLGAGAAIGVPAPGTWQRGAARAIILYGKITTLALIWGEFYLLILLAFPWLASTFEAIATLTGALLVITIVTIYGLASGKIPDGNWHKPVIVVTVLICLSGVYFAISKAQLARFGLPVTSSPVTKSEEMAIDMQKADQATLSTRQKRKLDAVEKILSCHLEKAEIAQLSEKGAAIYRRACSAEPKRLTLEELKEVEPKAYKIWQDSYGGGYLKGEKATPVKQENREARSSKGFTHYWDAYMRLKDTDPVIFWVSLIVGHVLLFWLLKFLWNKWKNGNTETVTATKVSVSTGPNWLERNKGLIVLALILFLAFYSREVWLPYVTSSKAFPNEFAKPTVFHKSAYLTSPSNHPLYGKELPVRVGEHAGRNELTNLLDWMNGGYNNKLVILTDLGDYELTQTVCNRPKIHTDSKVHVVCNGAWRQGNATSGTYEAVYDNSNVRTLSLSQNNGERLVFEVR